ncbi:MAG TPA: hypothetical protein VES20_06420 [Bryobacteraceae bacterium]|nr:hypothetical protein [Bryobacteraceae bacterium]
MLRSLICSIVLTCAAGAAILPQSFAGFQRSGAPSQPGMDPADKPLWDEYGLVEAERAAYVSGGSEVIITAWRLKDPTGAYGVRHWLGANAVVTHDNYVLRVEGQRPDKETMAQLWSQLPNRVSTAAPPLPAFLPARNRVQGSERYLLGSNALNRFAPEVPAELAALDRGGEGAAATYRLRGQPIQLTLISYPTPQMAQAFARKFAERSGLAFERKGPLIAVVPVTGAPPAAVQDLLKSVEYNPKLTWNEYVSKDTPQDAAKMILAIFALAGILIVLSLVLGLFFGGSRVMAEKIGWKTTDEALTSLHLGNK